MSNSPEHSDSDPYSARNPDLLSHVEAEELNRCRPLSNPSRHWVVVVLWILPVLILIHLFNAFLTGGNLRALVAMMVPLGIGMVAAYFIYRPLLQWIFKKRRAVFLRAFSRDLMADDRELRILLRAALPPDVALAGIRPPRTRAAWWTRVAGESFIAFRYIGSESFELEAADRNWFARLLATFAESHVILLDLRSLTPYVHDEIRLSFQAGRGNHRLFLIIDTTKTREEWNEAIRLACSPDLPSIHEDQFIVVDGQQNSEALAAELRGKFSAIPVDPLPLARTGLEFAKERVKPEDWATPWWQTPAATSLLGLAVWFALSTAFPDQAAVLGMLVAGFAMVLFLGCLFRLLKSAHKQRALGGRPRPGPAGVVGGFVSLIVSASVIGLAFAATHQATQRLLAMKAMLGVTNLSRAVEHYYLDYNKMPDTRLPELETSGSAWADFAKILAGREEQGDGMGNPRQIAYWSPYGSMDEMVKYLDPWGQPYVITLDDDYDDEIELVRGSRHDVVRSPVAIYSKGPDRKPGTEDDITSWDG